VPQQTFEAFGDNQLDVLARTCEPALQDLVDEAALPQLTLAFGEVREDETEAFINKADFAALPSAHQKMVQQAISLFQFTEKKTGQSFAPVFTPLLGALDEASKAFLLVRLGTVIPTEREAQKKFFETNPTGLSEKEAEDYKRRSSNLKRTLVDHNGMSPIGLLRECLQYARDSKKPVAPVFEFIKIEFENESDEIYKLVSNINSFRNTFVAHQEKPLTSSQEAKAALQKWIQTLALLWRENASEIYSQKCIVETLSITPKEQAQAGVSAELRVTLPDIELGPNGKLPKGNAEHLQREIERLIQPIADRRFGPNAVRVESKELRSGSLTFVVVITAIAGGGYQFVKDYDKLRANVILLVSDIKRACGRIRHSLVQLLEDPDNPFKK
jgi:type III restriction enzyme